MTLTDLIKRLQSIKKEINCEAHPFTSDGSVNINCDDPNDEYDYELINIEPDCLPGCGCCSGAWITISRKIN